MKPGAADDRAAGQRCLAPGDNTGRPALPQMLRGRRDRVRVRCLNIGIEIGSWQQSRTGKA